MKYTGSSISIFHKQQVATIRKEVHYSSWSSFVDVFKIGFCLISVKEYRMNDQGVEKQ